ASVAVQVDDPIEPADNDADRHLLAQSVRDRESRWKGAVTDPVLRAQLDTLQSAVGAIERQMRDFSDVAEGARALLLADSRRSADDYRDLAGTIRKKVEDLVGQIGELTVIQRQHKADLEKVQEEFRTL